MLTDTHASSNDANDEQQTVSEAAQLLGVHVQTVRRWADDGYLPSHRFGPHGYRRFWRSDLERIKAQNEGRDPHESAPRTAASG